MLLSLLSLPSFGVAQEITSAELEQLETKLSRLEKNNETLATDCKALKSQLAVSQEVLAKASTESEQLRIQLTELTLQSKSSEALLQTANELLQKSATEQKRIQARIKQQRTIAWCVAGVVAIYAAKK